MRLLIAIFCAAMAGQTAAAEVLRISGDLIEEVERESTPISKPGWLRGLHFVGRDLPVKQRPRISTVLPAAWVGETICGRVISMSGGYSAIIKFTVPSDLDQDLQAELDFKLKKASARKITPIDSGVSLEKGPCTGDDVESDKGPVRQFIVNYWNEVSEPVLNDKNEAELWINMNVARADELKARVAVEGGTQVPVSCEKLVTSQAIAFNFRCTVVVPHEILTSLDLKKLTFSYERIYRSRVSDTRSAEIYVGAGQ